MKTENTSYVLHYRLEGHDRSDRVRTRTLEVYESAGYLRPARTIEEAIEAIEELSDRPFINAWVNVLKLRRVTTTTVVEDITEDAVAWITP